MSGTGIGGTQIQSTSYAMSAIDILVCYAVPGTGQGDIRAVLRERVQLCVGTARRCRVQRGPARYAPTRVLCDVRYLPTRVLCDVRYLPTRVLCAVRYWYSVWRAICVRVCYAMSGTDIAYGATCVRVCYAMSATCLRACYAMSGTEMALHLLSPYAGSQLHAQSHRRPSP
eukprot:1163875-Rhodomonas_salina.1